MAENNLDTVTNFLVQQHTEKHSPSVVGDSSAAPEPQTPAPTSEDAAVPAEQDLSTENIEPEEENLLETTEEVDEEDDDDRSDGDEEEPKEVEYLDLRPDDLVEVMVDGEAKQVTLQDLKNAYGGEGAIDKRLFEATEERKAAIAEREKVAKENETAREALLSVVQQLDGILHQPTVAPPDERLKASNPKAYLDQLDRYQAEAANLEQGRAKLVEAFQQHAKHSEQVREQQRQQQLHLLHNSLAPLKNPETRKEAAKELLQAVDEYGFSPEDLKGVVDHRIYLMAYDAMQYRKLKAGAKDETQLGQLKERAEKKARVLRSASAGTRKRRASRSQKELRAAHDTAAKTGKVDDVAAFLVQNRRNRGK